MSDIDDFVRLFVHGTLDPAANMGAFISENAAIARELAERGPFLSDDMECADCGAYRDENTHDLLDLNDPANHEPSCLFRRSRELYPDAGVKG